MLLLVGAIRVGRPGSPWARWRYQPQRRRGEARMAKAQRRERRYRQPLIRWKIRVEELVGGRPDEPPPAEPEADLTGSADSSGETRTGLHKGG